MSIPLCMHCQQPFGAHMASPANRATATCPDGKNTFNCEFQVSDEAASFVQANLDKSPKELTELWLERIMKRSRQ